MTFHRTIGKFTIKFRFGLDENFILRHDSPPGNTKRLSNNEHTKMHAERI